MATEKKLEELSVEELVSIVNEKEATIQALTEQLSLSADAVAKVDVLEAENAELKLLVSKQGKVSKVVPGTYKSKKHKVEIRFKDGSTKTRVGHQIIDSAELIKNEDGKYTDALDHLIALGASTIEVIEK